MRVRKSAADPVSVVLSQYGKTRKNKQEEERGGEKNFRRERKTVSEKNFRRERKTMRERREDTEFIVHF